VLFPAADGVVITTVKYTPSIYNMPNSAPIIWSAV
jgi:hypothetical protein